MLADSDRLLQAEHEATECLKHMETMQRSMALAKQIVGLRDDRIKKELAIAVAGFLKDGESATASEWKARADKGFHEATTKIMHETADAQEILNEWELLKLRYDNATNLRSDERAKIKMV